MIIDNTLGIGLSGERLATTCISCGESSDVIVDGICSDCQDSIDNEDTKREEYLDTFSNVFVRYFS